MDANRPLLLPAFFFEIEIKQASMFISYSALILFHFFRCREVFMFDAAGCMFVVAVCMFVVVLPCGHQDASALP